MSPPAPNSLEGKMDFTKSRSIRRRGVKENTDDFYKHRLQFYKFPPTDTISLHEFEEYAVERLKVLKAIETAGIKFIKGSAEYREYVDKEIRKTLLRRLVHLSRAEDGEENRARKVDHISHFILRLAYCRSDELRRWFLQQELDLFRYRFLLETDPKEKKRFLQLNNLQYDPISDAEKSSLQEQLACSGNIDSAVVATLDYFKVPFTEALDLVSRRRVFVHKGMAYIPFNEMVSILLGAYRSHLSHSLAVTSRALPHLEEDERLLPMLSGLSKRYLGQDYNAKKTSGSHVTADMIDMLSKKSFPPCMQNLHQSLRQNHHLKHGGRMQYGLFLKAIGLSLDEAMKFWRAEFSKMMDGDKFDKQYAYNIRHNYGKEGKRADYTPYSCMKIIMSNAPGPGDNHGCPFRHTDTDLLKQRLKAQGLGQEYMDKINEHLKGGHCQLACTRYFEAVHHLPVESHAGINHPNQYFEDSHNPSASNKGGVGAPATPQSKKPQSSQATPKSQNSQSTNSQSGSSQLSGIDEMDDEFDMEAVEQSMQTS